MTFSFWFLLQFPLPVVATAASSTESFILKRTSVKDSTISDLSCPSLLGPGFCLSCFYFSSSFSYLKSSKISGSLYCRHWDLLPFSPHQKWSLHHLRILITPLCISLPLQITIMLLSNHFWGTQLIVIEWNFVFFLGLWPGLSILNLCWFLLLSQRTYSSHSSSPLFETEVNLLWKDCLILNEWFSFSQVIS